MPSPTTLPAPGPALGSAPPATTKGPMLPPRGPYLVQVLDTDANMTAFNAPTQLAAKEMANTIMLTGYWSDDHTLLPAHRIHSISIAKIR